MGDLLKTMRSSQIFSVSAACRTSRFARSKPEETGRPAALRGRAARPRHVRPDDDGGEHRERRRRAGWFLDTDWNGLSFHVSQAFFPRTSAWDNLKKALKTEYEESVWDHLAGTRSAPFEAGEHEQVAVKVIDDRGNELLVVKTLDEAE